MRIESVVIKNFKGITNSKLYFDKGFNLVIGDNGKGKTSILEAIAVGLGGFIGGIPGVVNRNFFVEEIRKGFERTGDGSCRVVFNVPVEIDIKANINDVEYEWTRVKTSIKAARSTIQPREIVRLAEKMSSSEDAELPILLFESAARGWSQKREKVSNPFGKKYIRTIGYTDALIEASNIKLIRNWCIKMEMSSYKMKKTIEEYEAAKKSVSRFMSIMNRDDEFDRYEVFFDSQLEEIMYRQGETILPVSSLSSGYQSLIWMVFDIAYRMAILNPHLGWEIARTQGVVLIDEIDMHLHPSWQWNVIKALKEVFPNVQFIATTHAPILFASAKNIKIIELEGDNVKYKLSKYGLDINNSVEVYQDTSEYPYEIKTLIESVKCNLDERDIVNAETELIKLKQLLDDDHPVITGLTARLELEKMDWGV